MLYRGGENVYSDVVPDLKVTDFLLKLVVPDFIPTAFLL